MKTNVDGAVHRGRELEAAARRAQTDATVRLGVVLSLVAVPVAAVASATGAATSLLVLVVLVVGFAASWAQSARIARLHRMSVRAVARRRVTVVAAPTSLG